MRTFAVICWAIAAFCVLMGFVAINSTPDDSASYPAFCAAFAFAVIGQLAEIIHRLPPNDGPHTGSE